MENGGSETVGNDQSICDTPRSAISVLEVAATHAANYLETLPHRPVAPKITLEELRIRLAKPLPETGMAPDKVIDELVRDIDDGILRSSSGRFFGWVIGGTLPVALAADWLTSWLWQGSLAPFGIFIWPHPLT
jgi:hypothetical protein